LTERTSLESSECRPAAGGGLNQIASHVHVNRYYGSNQQDDGYEYSMLTLAAPAPALKPRAAAVLLKYDGTPVIGSNGIQCPEAVDNTWDDNAGTLRACFVRPLTTTMPRLVRVLHSTI
jgi:hypothetical protein